MPSPAIPFTPQRFLYALAFLLSVCILLHPSFTMQARAQDNALDVDTSAEPDMTATIPDVPREFRAAWIATVANIDWPSKPGLTTEQQKDEMLALLDLSAEMGLNAVVFQVRPHADAMYDSKIEPWSYYLTKQQGQAPEPYYDPLAFTVEEAHKRGIEVHVWFNPYRALHPANPREKGDIAVNHVSKTMPGAVKKLGESEGVWWMDPADPDVQNQSLDVIADVLDRYDVDGIHFDDYFYPYPSYNDGKDFPDDPTWQAYQDAGGRLGRADWRRKAVNDFVENLHAVIRSKSPHVKFGISPFGIYRPGHPHYIKGFDQYEELYADALHWLEEGWLDYMAPQLYWEIRNPDQSFTGLLSWWNDNNPHGRHIWPGLYTSRLLAENPRYDDQEILAQVKWTRVLTEPSAGHIHFSIKALQQDALEVATQLKDGMYATDALMPASPWLAGGAPEAPAYDAQLGDDGVTVTLEDGVELPGLAWVVQVGQGGAWTHRVLPASQRTVTIEVPGTLAPGGGDEADQPVVVAVSCIDRASVSSAKSVVTLD